MICLTVAYLLKMDYSNVSNLNAVGVMFVKIKILGSGGGEGFPAAFCSCEHCETARKKGNKSLRTLSQTIINDDLLIDFPADTAAHCLYHGVNLGQLQNVLITHAHIDHFEPSLLAMRGGGFCHNLKYDDIYFYGPENLKQVCDTRDIAADFRKHIHFVPLEAYTPVTVGNYRVTALNALHAPGLGSLNYIIEQDGKCILYLLDSGYPTAETRTYLKNLNKVFDAVIMDATMGTAAPRAYIYHMCFQENKMLKTELEQLGIADDHTRFVVTHITHNYSEYHEKTEAIFADTAIAVAYDGYELTLA